jgi:hypothetical protein
MSTFNEKIILGACVMALTEEAYRVEVSDQDGGGLYIYAAENGGNIPEAGADYWIRFTSGNREAVDFITDYTTNLEDALKPVLALAELLDN